MSDQLEKGMRLHLLKNLINEKFVKKDFLDKDDLLYSINEFEKEVDSKIDINLKKELLKLKSMVIGKDIFEIEVIRSIKNGDFEIINLFEEEIKKIKDVEEKLKKLKCKLINFNENIIY